LRAIVIVVVIVIVILSGWLIAGISAKTMRMEESLRICSLCGPLGGNLQEKAKYFLP
jgi:hypothetical protein